MKNDEPDPKLLIFCSIFFTIVVKIMDFGINKYLKNKNKTKFQSKTAAYVRNSGIQKEYIVSLYLLPKLRDLVLNYGGVNEFLVELKKLFLHIDKKENNPAFLQLLADIQPTQKDPVDNLPMSTIVEILMNGAPKTDDKDTFETNKEDRDFMKLFMCKKDTCYIDLPNHTNDFFRTQFCAKNSRCTNTECNAEIYDQPGDEKTEIYKQMPEYYITRIFPPLEIDDFDSLKPGFLKKLYPLNHIAYVLDSFHVFLRFYDFKKVISCYKTSDNKWYNMFDGLKVKKEFIASLLNNKNDEITLFYRKID